MCRPILPALLLAVTISAVAAIGVPAIDNLKPDVLSKFQDFVKNFNMSFKNPLEKAHRMAVFAKNLDVIKALNEKSEGVVYGVTRFSHLTSEEYMKQMLPATGSFNMTVPDRLRKEKTPFNRTRLGPGFHGRRQKRQTLPTNFDWRSYSKVTNVRDQGTCGCCWAFAAVAAVESQYALWHGGLYNMCEQEVLDCAESNGCFGGTPHSALDWITQNELHFESAAPYQEEQGTCSALSGSTVSLDSYVEMWDWTEEEMKEYLYDYGPFAISFGMGDDTQFYSSTSGVYQSSNCPPINHAMLAVGYGVEGGVPYWLVKNQYGTGWGISGYMKIRRNVNMCGFAYQNVAAYNAY